MTLSNGRGEPGSQTLARGLAALTEIGDAHAPLTVPELAERLGVHRSMAYRLVRTLEQHGFVTRTAGGGLELGARVAALARNVARDLQTAAAPELTALANELGMTAFVVVHDGEEAVTLSTAEPRRVDAPVAQRPGSRHSIDRGAPGRVIRSQLDPTAHPPRRYETSHDEIFPGLSSVAVPLHTRDGRPASLAVVYASRDVDLDEVAATLSAAARRIEQSLG
ncbi:IclR family transcriptional regulator [Gryllotalpicola ginsengisoli]|uniref:IclR family transcriptional regulator n=1 Tax=Gryllotalpicola ginsengisoli TaxID=444608 RepID=UPI0004156182|nr:helix-turn-helix domain-containing protein [Gryllotalpicola ginsengisoli]